MTRFTLVALVATMAASADAFAPRPTFQAAAPATTQLQFKFLKELGLEKPDWLPDFGGKKEEEAAPVASSEDEESEEEAAEEE